MSMIGDWGICKKSSYDSLQASVRREDFQAARDAVQMVCGELEDSAEDTEAAACSGEVFLGLFDYLEARLGVDVGEREELGRLVEIWREETGDFAMVPFGEKERERLLSLAGAIDFEDVAQYVNGFFQADFGEAGEIACRSLFENLERLQPGCVLIWRLI